MEEDTGKLTEEQIEKAKEAILEELSFNVSPKAIDNTVSIVRSVASSSRGLIAHLLGNTLNGRMYDLIDPDFDKREEVEEYKEDYGMSPSHAIKFHVAFSLALQAQKGIEEWDGCLDELALLQDKAKVVSFNQAPSMVSLYDKMADLVIETNPVYARNFPILKDEIIKSICRNRGSLSPEKAERAMTYIDEETELVHNDAVKIEAIRQMSGRPASNLVGHLLGNAFVGLFSPVMYPELGEEFLEKSRYKCFLRTGLNQEEVAQFEVAYMIQMQIEKGEEDDQVYLEDLVMARDAVVNARFDDLEQVLDVYAQMADLIQRTHGSYARNFPELEANLMEYLAERE